MKERQRYDVEDLQTGTVWKDQTGKHMLFLIGKRGVIPSASMLFKAPEQMERVVSGRYRVTRLIPDPVDSFPPYWASQFSKRWKRMQRLFGIY